MAELTLSSDIQQALQHAVVEANNAFSQTNSQKKKKKKKRQSSQPGDQESNHTVNENETKRKRKKEDVAQEIAEGQGSHSALVTNAEDRPKKKRRKSSKGKRAQESNESEGFSQIDPVLASSLNPGSQASQTAFISAIVAAASANEAHHSQVQYPTLGSQVAPYPQMQYGYSPHAAHPSSTVFPTPMGPPLPDLSHSSNDDILRALQDLDVSKLANVLKTLSEAAAAANAPGGPMGYQQPNQQVVQALTSLEQVATTSDDILRRSTKKAKDKQSLPVPEQHVNQDQASILANKWMNAAKLADMVKTQGEC
jgi:hypothetical protein